MDTNNNINNEINTNIDNVNNNISNDVTNINESITNESNTNIDNNMNNDLSSTNINNINNETNNNKNKKSSKTIILIVIIVALLAIIAGLFATGVISLDSGFGISITNKNKEDNNAIPVDETKLQQAIKDELTKIAKEDAVEAKRMYLKYFEIDRKVEDKKITMYVWTQYGTAGENNKEVSGTSVPVKLVFSLDSYVLTRKDILPNDVLPETYFNEVADKINNCISQGISSLFGESIYFDGPTIIVINDGKLNETIKDELLSMAKKAEPTAKRVYAKYFEIDRKAVDNKITVYVWAQYGMADEKVNQQLSGTSLPIKFVISEDDYSIINKDVPPNDTEYSTYFKEVADKINNYATQDKDSLYGKAYYTLGVAFSINDEKLNETIKNELLSMAKEEPNADRVYAKYFEIDRKAEDNKITVYVWAQYGMADVNINKQLSGISVPIKFIISANDYSVISKDKPKNGEGYATYFKELSDEISSYLTQDKDSLYGKAYYEFVNPVSVNDEKLNETIKNELLSMAKEKEATAKRVYAKYFEIDRKAYNKKITVYVWAQYGMADEKVNQQLSSSSSPIKFVISADDYSIINKDVPPNDTEYSTYFKEVANLINSYATQDKDSLYGKAYYENR